MSNVYPEKFYDFSNGVPIDEKTITEWLKDVKKQLSDQKDGSFSFIASGNTLVVGFKFSDEYSFIVADRYKELHVLKEEINSVTFE